MYSKVSQATTTTATTILSAAATTAGAAVSEVIQLGRLQQPLHDNDAAILLPSPTITAAKLQTT